ncbi:ABC transporter substrate-binding protein [Glycomyces salinus]|uniref:ABC transporter substrate-binding protein n=1 Tax=Glycomyces salinus TaxID=980294 RepID=UPI0018EB27E0|nr:ABC transporter substrate-binding protein [Glycomyces salinus]
MRSSIPTRRIAAAAAALAVAAGALAGTASGAAAQDDVDRLLIATDQEVDTFNPFKSRYIITYNTNTMTYESLIRPSAESYEPEPGLATEWEESGDGLTWTFQIREGAEWSDGEPLTAHDVAYTYGLLIENEDIRDWNIDVAGNFVSAEATDDTTFVLTLNEPAPSAILSSQTFIVPQHIWEDYPDPAADDANDELPLVGSGPFQVAEYRTDELLRLEANENYWGGAPAFDELVYDYYNEPDAAVAALEAGEVDIVNGLNPAQVEALEAQDHVTVNNAQGRRFVSITFNHGAATADGTEYGDGHPALRDPVVRQAMHTAIDKQELVDRVLDGNGTPATSLIPAIFEQWHWEGGDSLVEFDINEANRMLDEAGYELGEDGVRTMPDSDQRLSFRFYHHADNTDYATIVEFVSEWWEEIGIEVDAEPIEQGSLNDLVYLGEYDIAFSGWGTGPNPSDMLGMHTCAVLPTGTDGSERSHENFYCDEEFDSLHERQKVESDPDARAELVKEQQRILYEDAPVVWVYYQNVLEAYNHDKVDGLTTQPSENGMITGQEGFQYSYWSATPVDGGGEEGGASTGVLIGVGVAAAAVVVAAVVFFVRRRSTADERE